MKKAENGENIILVGDYNVAYMDADVYNPAFDVTPAALITAIITDRGIHRPPFTFAA